MLMTMISWYTSYLMHTETRCVAGDTAEFKSRCCQIYSRRIKIGELKTPRFFLQPVEFEARRN